MEYWLSHLPLEVWVDVFCYPWISRTKLGRIVQRFRNRRFAEFLQFYLHDWGKHTLDICLNESALSEISQTPMPGNIRFFDQISIRHFDSRTLDFLRQIGPLFNGADVNLDLSFNLERANMASLRTILDHLAPLIHGIHSLAFNQWAIPLVEQYFAPKLAQIKMIKITVDWWHPQATIDFAMDWLISGERDPSEPKLLELCTNRENFRQIGVAIQEQFLSANRPCTFALRFSCYGQIPAFQLENSLGEQLHGEFDEFWFWTFEIFRHQPKPNACKALKDWVDETYRKSDRPSRIELSDRLTIGPIDANADANEVDDVREVEEDGPSTSKKPRLG